MEPREIRLPRPRITALALVGALATAFVAQYLFTGEVFTRLKDSATWAWKPRYGAGVALLLVAVALAAWFGRRDEGEPAPPACEPRVGGPVVPWAAGISVALTAAAIGLFLLWGESGTVRTLWALAMLSLVFPLLLSALRKPRVVPSDAARWSPWEGPALVALTFAGFLLRFYRITELPEHVDNDVALMGVETLHMMRSHDPRWFGLAASEHLLSSHQIQALGLRLFGSDHFGLVMLSVLAGTLTLPVLYVLAREAFSRRVALVATVLLTTSYTHIQFSRILFGPTATFFLCLSFAHLFRAFRTGRALNWAAGGLAMGLSLLTYDSSRVGPVIVLAFLAASAFLDRTALRRQAAGWGLFLAGAFVGFGPMTGFVFRSLNSFVGRGNTVMVWSPDILQHSMDKYHVGSLPAVLFEQTRRTFLTLHLYGDASPHFAFPRPMVGALAAALCVLGTGLGLARLRRAPHFLVLAWVVLTFILGGVLTADPPFWPHLNIALPAVALLAGLGADRLARSVEPLAPRGNVLVPAVMGLALLASGVHDWVVYTRFADDNAGRRIEAARFLDGLPVETYVYMIADDTSWQEYCFRFFDGDMSGRNVTADELVSGREKLPTGRPYTIVLFGHEDAIPLLSGLSPLSRVEAHGDRDGTLLFTSVSVIPPGFRPRVQPAPIRPGLLPLALAALAGVGWVLFTSLRSFFRMRRAVSSRYAGASGSGRRARPASVRSTSAKTAHVLSPFGSRSVCETAHRRGPADVSRVRWWRRASAPEIRSPYSSKNGAIAASKRARVPSFLARALQAVRPTTLPDALGRLLPVLPRERPDEELRLGAHARREDARVREELGEPRGFPLLFRCAGASASARRSSGCLRRSHSSRRLASVSPTRERKNPSTSHSSSVFAASGTVWSSVL